MSILFSKAGLINQSRHLWIKVQTFDPLKKLWNYNNGEHLGIKESTAYNQQQVIKNILQTILDYKNVDLWLAKGKAFYCGRRQRAVSRI